MDQREAKALTVSAMQIGRAVFVLGQTPEERPVAVARPTHHGGGIYTSRYRAECSCGWVAINDWQRATIAGVDLMEHYVMTGCAPDPDLVNFLL